MYRLFQKNWYRVLQKHRYHSPCIVDFRKIDIVCYRNIDIIHHVLWISEKLISCVTETLISFTMFCGFQKNWYRVLQKHRYYSPCIVDFRKTDIVCYRNIDIISHLLWISEKLISCVTETLISFPIYCGFQKNWYRVLQKHRYHSPCIVDFRKTDIVCYRSIDIIHHVLWISEKLISCVTETSTSFTMYCGFQKNWYRVLQKHRYHSPSIVDFIKIDTIS